MLNLTDGPVQGSEKSTLNLTKPDRGNTMGDVGYSYFRVKLQREDGSRRWDVPVSPTFSFLDVFRREEFHSITLETRYEPLPITSLLIDPGIGTAICLGIRPDCSVSSSFHVAMISKLQQKEGGRKKTYFVNPNPGPLCVPESLGVC